MIADMHVHSVFSSDSETPIEAHVEQAISLGMKQICITDHQDYDYPEGYPSYLIADLDDTPGYLAKVAELKEQYAHRIQLLCGVEIGLQPHLGARIHDYAARYPFDFIIGSTHVYGGKDTSDRTLYEGRSEEEAAREYFMTELQNVQAVTDFDVIGHLDFVTRHLPSKNRCFHYSTFADILDEILKTVIARGKGIECNTVPLANGFSKPHPIPEIILRYRELGGEIITLGSDAHTPDRMGSGFAKATEILKSCGFRYYTVFEQRRPNFYPFP